MGFKVAIAILVASQAHGDPLLAEPWYPTRCCPLTCKTVSGFNPEIALSDLGGTDHGTGPAITRNTLVGVAPDNRTHVCIGFDEFGNPELKCLFRPPMM